MGEPRKYDKLLQAGLAILPSTVGTLVGSASGFLVGDPISGALAGSAASEGLRRVAEEVSTRYLGEREEKRVGALIIMIASRIKQRLDAGECLRQDGFFGDHGNQRTMSDAEQIAERALLVAQRDPEESKLFYVGNLIANLCFDDRFDVCAAHQLVKQAEHLTYRQLCILKLGALMRAADHRPIDVMCYNLSELSVKSYNDRGINKFSNEQVFILTDCLDMYHSRLITVGHMTDDISHIVPRKIGVIGVGVYLWELMGLHDIPQEDLLPIMLVL